MKNSLGSQDFAHLQTIHGVSLRQETYKAQPDQNPGIPGALLGGLCHLQDISRARLPSRPGPGCCAGLPAPVWADYSDVSRTLSTLSYGRNPGTSASH